MWVIIADKSRARICDFNKAKKSMYELLTLIHPNSRIHAQELTSDLPGRSFDSQGKARHILEMPTPVKKHQAILFANDIANYLERACNSERFKQLGIVAPPEFLGILRQQLNPKILKLVDYEISKNMTQLSLNDIKQELSKQYSRKF